MSNIEIVLDAVEFMESNLTEDISVSDVADSVALSLFHFSRVFSRTTRHSPYDYLIRRRLCEAARRLIETDEKIIDIALAYRFNAPESFSRTFRRMFGLQPRQVRSASEIDRRRLLLPPTRAYLEFLNGKCPPNPSRYTLPVLHVVGIAGRFMASNGGNDRQALWRSLDRQLDLVAVAEDDRQRYGIMLYDPAQSSELYTYLAGVLWSKHQDPPSALLEKRLAAAEYVRFALSRHADAERFTRTYVYQTWWPKATTSPPKLIEVECWPHHANGRTEATRPSAICLPLPTDIVR